MSAAIEASTAPTAVSPSFLAEPADTLDLDHEMWSESLTLPTDVEAASVAGL